MRLKGSEIEMKSVCELALVLADTASVFSLSAFCAYLYKDLDHQGHHYFVFESAPVDWPWQNHVCPVFSLL